MIRSRKNTYCGPTPFLEAEDLNAGINLYISSPGGSITANGDLRHDAVHQNDVTTICVGQYVDGGVALMCQHRWKAVYLLYERLWVIRWSVERD